MSVPQVTPQQREEVRKALAIEEAILASQGQPPQRRLRPGIRGLFGEPDFQNPLEAAFMALTEPVRRPIQAGIGAVERALFEPEQQGPLIGFSGEQIQDLLTGTRTYQGLVDQAMEPPPTQQIPSRSAPSRTPEQMAKELRAISEGLFPKEITETSAEIEALQKRADAIFAGLEEQNVPRELSRGQKLQRVLAGAAAGGGRVLTFPFGDRDIGVPEILAGAGPAALAAEISSQEQLAESREKVRARAADISTARLNFDTNLLRLEQAQDNANFNKEFSQYQLGLTVLKEFGPDAERVRLSQELAIHGQVLQNSLLEYRLRLAANPTANMLKMTTARGEAFSKVPARLRPLAAAVVAVSQHHHDDVLLNQIRDRLMQEPDPFGTGTYAESFQQLQFSGSETLKAAQTRFDEAVEKELVAIFTAQPELIDSVLQDAYGTTVRETQQLP